jgi:predicted metal-dependent phosphoesterase TrpH
MRVDLHTHTTCSDGQLTPAELVAKADAAGLGCLAITDHDTVDAWPDALKAAAEYDLELVPGVELTSFLDGKTVHLLGYFFAPDNPSLIEFLKQDRDRRRRRAAAIVDKLNGMDIPISFEAVLEQADGGSICRPHIARALLAEGYISSYHEAFVRYIGDDGPAYVDVRGASPAEAIRIIRQAGGITSVAHPGQHVTEDMLDQLIDAGIDGIEVFHPAHDTLMTEQYRRIARERDLLVTGGSDYHGYRKVEDQRIGYYGLSPRQMDFVREHVASRARS